MKIGDTVKIRSGAFAGYTARVVAIHEDHFEGAVSIFGREGVAMFAASDLQEAPPSVDPRSPTARVREEYMTLRRAGVEHEDAVVDAAIELGFDEWIDEDTVVAPKWVWEACK